MRRILFSLLILVFFAPGSYSNDDEQLGQWLEIHINPVPLIDLTPRWRLGFEYKYNPKLAFDLELGYGNYAINKWRFKGTGSGLDYTFKEIRPEVKYHFLNLNEEMSLYAAAELFYLNMTQSMTDSYYHLENHNAIIRYDEAIFHKEKMGVHLKGGLQLLAFKRLTLDFYGGLGLAQRWIGYADIINPVFDDVVVFEEWIPQIEKYPGTKTIFHLTMGFKVGIVLWKQQ